MTACYIRIIYLLALETFRNVTNIIDYNTHHWRLNNNRKQKITCIFLSLDDKRVQCSTVITAEVVKRWATG